MSEQMEQIGAAAVCASVRETTRANTSSWGDAGRIRGRYRHDEVCEQTERGAMWVVARACVCSLPLSSAKGLWARAESGFGRDV